ncbi:MAG: DEAD/DEAH box helicase [Candidatus Paceibacterota bacterium]
MNNSYQTTRRGGGQATFRRQATSKRSPNRSFRGGGGNRFRGKKISHDKFINKNPSAPVEENYAPVHTFRDFGFDRQLTNNLVKKGYQIPTKIQDEAIPQILNGRDIVGLANTGSGKTAAFVLPIIQKLIKQKNRETVLVITPTRELAQQIQGEFKQFADRLRLYSVLCVGGLNIRQQIREIKREPQMIIGTPGRLKDLLQQGELNLRPTTTLVLDEADRMLDMGFLPDVKFIIGKLPAKRQSLCFSATMVPEISRLLADLLHEPVTISVRSLRTAEHIGQDVIRAQSKEEKLAKLTALLAQAHFTRVLVFAEMKFSVQRLADDLTKAGFPAVAIHGNKSQPQRSRALNAFKTGQVKILVATDVAARGLDIPAVSQVINFDQPNTYEEYIHRIGRTGRAGLSGQAYTFI